MKRLVSFLLTAIIITSALPLSVISANASPFSGGDGSEANPYLVATPEALDAVRNYPKAHYRQTADIDMSSFGNWTPIPRFEGTYDGGNYDITNFSLNDTNYKITNTNNHIGLFSYLCNAEVRNIRLESMSIHFDLSKHDYVPSSQYSSLLFGGLAGTADGSVVKNCSVSGSISISNYSYIDIGGLIGYLSKGSSYSTIEDCSSSCKITVDGGKGTSRDDSKYLFCGGLVGNTTCNMIDSCSNVGNIDISVEGHCYVGGIVGSAAQSMSAMNCYNLGNITAEIGCNGFIGGIAGRTSAGGLNDIMNLSHCSNSGAISASIGGTAYVGGIVGQHKSNNGRSSHGGAKNSQNLGSLNVTVTSAVPEAYVGGIAGTLKACAYRVVNYGNIKLNSAADSQSQVFVGGIIGKELWPDTIVISGNTVYYIKNCFNLAEDISACLIGADLRYSSQNVGRILGNDSESTECYSNKEALVNGAIRYGSLPTDKNGGDLTADALLLKDTYRNFDFSNEWTIDNGVGGPVLLNVPISATEADPESPFLSDFNDLIYRADYLTKGKASILTDPAIYSLLLTNNFTPSRIIVDSHPENMQTVAAAWEALKATVDAADGNASQVLKQNTKQEDLITAYILGAVGTYTDFQFADAVKNNFKHTQNLVKVLCELNGTYAMAGDEFKEFIKGKEDDIEKLLCDYYEKNDPTMSALLKAKKGISVVSSVISTANSIEDVVSEISSYSKLYGINESTKEALLLMYEVCPEESKALKNALKLTAEIVSSANEEMINDIAEREFAFALCRETAYAVTDKLWGYMTDAFVDKCPVAKGYVVLAKMELTVMDKFFGIDARTEQYFKLCTLNEVDSVAGLAVHQAMNNYMSSPTSENAATFLSAIELKFGFIDQSYSESIKYSEVITDSGILQKMENGFRDLFGIDSVNVLKESLIGAEKAKNSLHCTLLTAWISDLDAENHSLAENYYEYREAMFTRYEPENANDFIEVFRNAAKQYSIHCPVNVKVFLPSGELIAEVGEDSIFASEDIAVIYYHGEKEIIFFEDGDYILSCEGYDEGDMDIGITEFDSEGNIVRKVNYNNIPVAPSSIHAMSGTELKTNDGNSIPVDYDSARASEKHKVSIENGVISGYLPEIEASAGERIEISAIIPEGYRFVGWQGDAEFEDASSASTYFFMKDGEVSVSAKFKKLDRDEDEDDDKPSEGIPVIIIFVIAGGAIITLSGIAILIVMIKERKKNSKKEKGNEADSL